MKFNFRSRAPTVFCLLGCIPYAIAHTWLEHLSVIASNGKYVGDLGYPRAYVPRTAGGDSNVHLLPPNGSGRTNAILPTDPMCQAAQTLGTQSANFPSLKAAAKDHVALAYEENGHVTLFKNQPGKPAGRGTVFVYGTKQASNSDTFLGIHRQWNADGTGGDKRGKLLAIQPFDDGRCFQTGSTDVAKSRSQQFGYPNTGGDLLCQNAIQLPDDAGTSGKYTLYWVWEWPYLFTNGNVQTNESYTSCVDIDLVASPVANAGAFNTQGVKGTAINSVAVEAQFSTAFMIASPALPQPTSDNPGQVQPGGIQYTGSVVPAPATSAAPKPTTASAKAPAAAAPTADASTTQKTSTSSKAPTSVAVQNTQAPAPSGFITVTVAVPTTVPTTVTVTMDAAQTPKAKSSSASISYMSTVYIVSMVTQTDNAAAKTSATAKSQTNEAGGVYVSLAPAPSSPSSQPSPQASSSPVTPPAVSSSSSHPSQEATTTPQTPAASSTPKSQTPSTSVSQASSKATSETPKSTLTTTQAPYTPVSLASGKYTNPTNVPSLAPFLNTASKVARAMYTPVRRRRL